MHAEESRTTNFGVLVVLSFFVQELGEVDDELIDGAGESFDVADSLAGLAEAALEE